MSRQISGYTLFFSFITFEAFQHIEYQNAIVRVAMLSHNYLPNAIGLNTIKDVIE